MLLSRIPAGGLLLALGLLILPAAMTGPAAAAQTMLGAPDTVDPGQQVTITIDTSSPAGRLELRGPHTGKDVGAVVGAYPVTSARVSFTAPSRAGTYQVSYRSASGRVLARTSFDVAAAPVLLNIPGPLGAGYPGRVQWRGPAAPGDMLQVYDPVTRKVLTQTPAKGSSTTQNSTMVPMPEAKGEFQIRYWSGAARVPLRSVTVNVGRNAAGWLRSPIEARAGRSFEVQWNGPTDARMEYRLTDANGNVLESRPVEPQAGGGKAVTFKAPSMRGRYRVQLVNSGSGFAIADLPLSVR